MKHLKRISLGLVALSAVATLAACSSTKVNKSTSSSSDSKNASITFWDENAGPSRTPIWKKIIADFEKKYPSIKVEYVGLPKDSAKSKIDNAISAKTTPDVASLQTSWLPQYQMEKALVPLDSYFKESALKDKINAKTVKFNKQLVADKKLYGIPYTQNLDILWVRTDLFKEKGVALPTTWDNFFAAAKDMTYNGMYGYAIRGGAGSGFQLQRMMFGYTGQPFFNSEGKTNINSKESIKFVTKYMSMYNKYTSQSDISNDFNAMVAGFDTGKVAMIQHNIGSYGNQAAAFKPNQFEAVAIPKSVKNNYNVEGGNTIGVSMFTTTKNKTASWKFIQFVNSAPEQGYWNKKVGQIPTNSDVMKEQWLKDSQHLKVAFNVYNDKTTVQYQPPLYLPEYRSILDNTVDPNIQAVMGGKMSVKDFLDGWAKAINDSKAKYDAAMKK